MQKDEIFVWFDRSRFTMPAARNNPPSREAMTIPDSLNHEQPDGVPGFSVLPSPVLPTPEVSSRPPPGVLNQDSRPDRRFCPNRFSFRETPGLRVPSFGHFINGELDACSSFPGSCAAVCQKCLSQRLRRFRARYYPAGCSSRQPTEPAHDGWWIVHGIDGVNGTGMPPWFHEQQTAPGLRESYLIRVA